MFREPEYTNAPDTPDAEDLALYRVQSEPIDYLIENGFGVVTFRQSVGMRHTIANGKEVVRRDVTYGELTDFAVNHHLAAVTPHELPNDEEVEYERAA